MAEGVDRGGRRAGSWLPMLILIGGCAKETEAARAIPTPPRQVAAPSVDAPSPTVTPPGHAKLQSETGLEEASATGNPDDLRFTLLVSNQSSALPSVEIQVRIDGRQVVNDSFALGSGHTAKRYELRLAEGRHELRATAQGGNAAYEGSIDMQGELWGALLFWRSPMGSSGDKEQQPAFTFDLQDTPIRLR
jgi:hypothetical protein